MKKNIFITLLFFIPVLIVLVLVISFCRGQDSPLEDDKGLQGIESFLMAYNASEGFYGDTRTTYKLNDVPCGEVVTQMYKTNEIDFLSYSDNILSQNGIVVKENSKIVQNENSQIDLLNLYGMEYTDKYKAVLISFVNDVLSSSDFVLASDTLKETVFTCSSEDYVLAFNTELFKLFGENQSLSDIIGDIKNVSLSVKLSRDETGLSVSFITNVFTEENKLEIMKKMYLSFDNGFINENVTLV